MTDTDAPPERVEVGAGLPTQLRQAIGLQALYYQTRQFCEFTPVVMERLDKACASIRARRERVDPDDLVRLVLWARDVPEAPYLRAVEIGRAMRFLVVWLRRVARIGYHRQLGTALGRAFYFGSREQPRHGQ